MDKKHIPSLKERGVVKDCTASVSHPLGVAVKIDIYSAYPVGYLPISVSAFQSEILSVSQKAASEYAYAPRRKTVCLKSSMSE